MSDWRSRLRSILISGDPAGQGYYARPPSGLAWPGGVPDCQELAEFYAICDGGHFFEYNVAPLGEMMEWTDQVREWVARYSDKPTMADCLIAFGDHEYGHVIWDSGRDRVGVCDMDGSFEVEFSDRTGPDLVGRPIAAFLDRLYSRPWPSDPVENDAPPDLDGGFGAGERTA